MKEHKCFCLKAGNCPWHGTVTDAESWKICREKHEPPPKPDKPPCVYLGSEFEAGRKGRDLSTTVYACKVHGECTRFPDSASIPDCSNCKQYTSPTDYKKLRKDFLDPLHITGRMGDMPTHHLRNMLDGGAAFLVCGGPSVRQVAYRRLSERGIFSLGVNNVAGFVPVSAFVCSDPPSKFHWGIFSDPNIIKFLPTPKLRGNRAKLRRKTVDGTFAEHEKKVYQCPNVYGFSRRSWLMPDDTWFTEDSAAWGNHKEGVERFGQPKTVCTMLLGLRLLQYLGARKIFLLGVDFAMNPMVGLKENYCFGEHRKADAVSSNNNQYQVTNEWLVQLRPVFERWGFHTYNTNQASHLRAFDYYPFEQALEVCRGDVPEEPFDLERWYEK